MIYEVEKRALITKKTADSLITFLDKNAKKIKKEHRFAFIYMDNKDLIPNQDDPVDIRVKITNTKPKLSLKYGSWHAGSARQEYEVEFALTDLGQYLKILFFLGKKWGTTNSTTRTLYKYKAMIITIDKHEDFKDYLVEVEITTSKKSAVKTSEEKINEFMSGFELAPLDSPGMIKFVDDLKNRPKWQFDFTQKNIDSYLKVWKEYIHAKF